MAVLAVLMLLASESSSAQGKKSTLGYATVGPAGIGLWMDKETGAFEKYGIDTLIFISSGPVGEGFVDKLYAKR